MALKFARASAASLLLAVALIACSDKNEYDGASAPATVMAGSASRSLLPTVSGGRDYLQNAPGGPVASELGPDNPGIFISSWDQGRVDVGNGNSAALLWLLAVAYIPGGSSAAEPLPI